MHINLKSNGMTNRDYKFLIEYLRREAEKEEFAPLHISGISRENFIDAHIDYYVDLFSYDKKRAFKLFRNPKGIVADMSVKGIAYENNKKAYVVLPFSAVSDYGFLRNRIKNHDLLKKVFTTYHEIKHLLQKTKGKQNLYEMFCTDLCTLYVSKCPKDYDNHHDTFYHEIDANIYGIKKTEEFFKKFPELYDENKDEIEKMKKDYQFDKNNFDFDDFLSGMLKKPMKIAYTSKIDGIRHKSTFDFLLHNFIIPDIEYSNDPSKKKLLYSIFSNPDYFNTLDFNYLDNGTKKQILMALEWKNEKLINRQRFNNRFLYSGVDSWYKGKIENINIDIQNKLALNMQMTRKVQSFLPKYNTEDFLQRDTVISRPIRRR